MTEHMRRDEKLTTADIVRGERVTEDGSSVAPPSRGTAEHVDRPSEVRAPGPVPGEPAERAGQQPGPLLPGEESRGLLSQWDSIQTAFVDEPRKSVEQADALVASTVKRLAEIFADERSKLEGQWHRGDRISTEELRMALQRYRSFFTRLLAV